jgi:hypothetical protein
MMVLSFKYKTKQPTANEMHMLKEVDACTSNVDVGN